MSSKEASPGKFKRGFFTMVAKDNVDHNATSNTPTKHFHGTSTTIMQTPTPGKTGTNISNVEDTTLDTSDKPESIENTAANGLNSLTTKKNQRRNELNLSLKSVRNLRRMSTFRNLPMVCMQCLAQLLIQNTTQTICTIRVCLMKLHGWTL